MSHPFAVPVNFTHSVMFPFTMRSLPAVTVRAGEIYIVRSPGARRDVSVAMNQVCVAIKIK